MRDILVRAAVRKINGGGEEPLEHKAIAGLDKVEKIVVVDQSPIGRTPRLQPGDLHGIFHAHSRLVFQSSAVAASAAMRPAAFRLMFPAADASIARATG